MDIPGESNEEIRDAVHKMVASLRMQHLLNVGFALHGERVKDPNSDFTQAMAGIQQSLTDKHNKSPSSNWNPMGILEDLLSPDNELPTLLEAIKDRDN